MVLTVRHRMYPGKVAATKQLTRDDWIQGALELIAERGVPALAVEPLAKRLKATKGSFYWHFSNKAELLAAVLECWVEFGTRQPIAALVTDAPATRLRNILTLALGGDPYDQAEWKLLVSNDLQVVETARRVHGVRKKYIADQLEALGYCTEQAQGRAQLAYAAYLGNLTLLATCENPPESSSATTSNFVDLLLSLMGLGDSPRSEN